jgi:DNA (cytosine-5)-methyltransferase 1
MRHGSLFSGIGGFDLAADWMGWENVFHCEWNPFGQKVLKHYWPNAKSYEDITKTNFSIHRDRIDILTGGFPCQPYSTAGKRLGKEDDRHLWPQMLRAIREIKPSWIVGENVLGLVNWSEGLVFHEVQSDLEAQGYEVQPYILPAAAIGSPHIRKRVFFIAHSKSIRQKYTLENGELEGRRFRQLYKRNIWDTFPSVSPICIGNDGISDRLDNITFSKWREQTLMAAGNSVVPQLILQIFKAIDEYETINY